MLYSQTIELPTSKKQEMIDVTKRVRAIVAASNAQNGLCSIFCGHTTGAVTINENTDPDVQTDILNALERAVPSNEKYYKHEEGNAHAHAKAVVLGSPRPSRCREGSSRSAPGRRSISASSTGRGTGSSPSR